MITITAASASGPMISRANDTPARAITVAASPISTANVGESGGVTTGEGARFTGPG